jgi:hypothetical protein
MNLKKSMAVLAFVAATGLFAGDLAGISTLVDKINNTKDLKVKTKLMDDLDYILEKMDKKDLPKAKAIIDKNLKLKS